MKIRSIALAVSLVLAPALLAADFGIRAGQYRDADDTFVGAEVVIDSGILNINPNIEYSLADNVTAGSVNLDVTLDVGRFGTIVPYLGAGIGLLYFDDDFGGEQTDAVGNLIGGLQFQFASLRPYAQVKYFRLLEDDDGDTDEIALAVGLRF